MLLVLAPGAQRGHAPERVLAHPHPNATRFGVLRACRRHQPCRCIKRRLRYVCVLWAALGQANCLPVSDQVGVSDV